MAASDRVRCFVALDFSEAIKIEAQKVQSQLTQIPYFDGRLTKPGNFHLTLKFLGQIEAEKLAAVETALGQIRFSRPTIELQHVGMFAPSIVWVKVDGADEIQREVDRALSFMFEPENRFMGHLTVARIKKKKSPGQLARSLQDISVLPHRTTVESFSLYRSVLNHEGPTYSVLKKYELLSPDSI